MYRILEYNTRSALMRLSSKLSNFNVHKTHIPPLSHDWFHLLFSLHDIVLKFHINFSLKVSSICMFSILSQRQKIRWFSRLLPSDWGIPSFTGVFSAYMINVSCCYGSLTHKIPCPVGVLVVTCHFFVNAWLTNILTVWNTNKIFIIVLSILYFNE